MVYTFWEGKMPAYIKLCMQTWKIPYVLLNYDNVNQYTDIPIEKLKDKFTLPQIADFVRAHVLRDNGGYWLDADTIMLREKLPQTNLIGYPNRRDATIGFLYAENPKMPFYVQWCNYQDEIVNEPLWSREWNCMGNNFTDQYLREHKNISIGFIILRWPETYVIDGDISRYDKYRKFYFDSTYTLAEDLIPDILMLHNSWTPEWYKKLSEQEVLQHNCTLSKILKEVLSCNT